MTETWLTRRSTPLKTDDEEKKKAHQHTHRHPRVCRKREEVGNPRVLAAVTFNDAVFLRCESALVREMKQGHTRLLFILRSNSNRRRKTKKRDNLSFLFISLITVAPLSHLEGVYEARPPVINDSGRGWWRGAAWRDRSSPGHTQTQTRAIKQTCVHAFFQMWAEKKKNPLGCFGRDGRREQRADPPGLMGWKDPCCASFSLISQTGRQPASWGSSVRTIIHNTTKWPSKF